MLLSACSGTAPTVSIELGALRDADAVDEQLPAALTFDDRMGSAVVAPLPQALEVETDTASREFLAGDVVYSPAEQSIIVFTRGGSAASDHSLVLLGRVTDGMGELSSCVHDCSVRVELH
ncbi:cyclophilin-like fold protein [Microbacterium sp. ZKA21]|uniref:cyclophilin-like fold protein n=1 Tax=Microbacterium sp. ZKA21 TaxID=3381694 RepID=UPI003D21CBE8